MYKIIEAILKRIRPFYRVINIITISTFFIIACYILYYYYVIPIKKRALFKDVLNTGSDSKTVVVHFFFADWCPHCKKAKPEWQAYRNKTDGHVISGFNVINIEHDCTNDQTGDPELQELIERYKIESYPMVIMDGYGLSVNFESKITEDSLEKFVSSVLETEYKKDSGSILKPPT